MTIREFLSSAVFRGDELERFLDPKEPTWAKHDRELGYRLNDILMRDGIDGCYTIGSYLPNGARRTIHYADQPCRINTYGDSFTQCHQVSDAETWQEVLSAHFGEPIRNFGVGGFGVYQAYRRVRRTEPTADGAPYVILNIFDDDHTRNLDMARWMRTNWFHAYVRKGGSRMFHATPWAHVRLDHTTGKFVEKENPFPTPESLYRLCDADLVYEVFGRDETILLELLQQGGAVEDVAPLHSLADALGVPRIDTSDSDSKRQSARRLLQTYGIRSTLFVLDLTRRFLDDRGKKLLVLLSYGSDNVVNAIRGRPPFDQPLLDYLRDNKLKFVDIREHHVRDAQNFRLDPEEYCKRYFIGHYSPAGNHFFAFAVKDAIVDWLDPHPITYKSGEASFMAAAATLA